MDTIYNLQKRADELRKKTETDSITPEDVGSLHADTLAYLADMEQNIEGLGIKRVYKSYAAMTAEGEEPTGTNGKLLKFGQLVAIYDAENTAQAETGNIYAWQKGTGVEAWLQVGNISRIDEMRQAIDTVQAAAEKAQAAADAVVGVISVDEIDNVPASVEDAAAMGKDTKHSRWTLEKDGQNIGVVEIFSDNMGHQLTEVLTTHNVMKSDGTLDFTTHDDTAVYRYYRSYNISSPHLTNETGTWSVWAEDIAKTVTTYISALADSLNSVKTSFEDFSKTKGEAGGLATLDEEGKVPEEQLPIKKQVVAFNGVVSGVAMLGASTESIDGVVYDKEAKRFCGYQNGGTVLVPTVTYYKNWPTRSDYEDTDTDVPYTERIYVDMTDCLPYVWNGTEMKCLSVKTVVLTQDEYDALVAANAIDENTYYNVLEDE